jgi:hypothetical protein
LRAIEVLPKPGYMAVSGNEADRAAQLDREIAERRADPEFMARLARRMDEDREVLALLAEDPPPPDPSKPR